MVAADGDGPPTPTPAVATAPARADAPPPTPTPQPLRPRGAEERALLAATLWETRLVIRHSGNRGPVVMVLGGVHGNEPGGWLAADQVATWEPAAGSLLVVPRANVLAIRDFVRTTEAMGDLNRLYPGNPDSDLPMERMAAAIVAAASEFEVDTLLDMHESWAFYAEYPGTGTAALGQTLTPGVGPRREAIGVAVAARVNPAISRREQLIVRDGTQFRRPDSAAPAAQQGRGRSSLAIGGAVTNLTPVLMEMGQMDQSVERRVDLHLLVARTLMEEVGIL